MRSNSGRYSLYSRRMHEARLVEAVADGVRRARARAEHAEWTFIVDTHVRRTAEIDRADDAPISKELTKREVTLGLANALHVTETQIWAMVSEAAAVREHAPHVWAAFAAGDIDGVRVTSIAATLERLTTTKAREVLDATAPVYAATHTVAELRAWLRRLRSRLEPQTTAEETADALTQRRVHVNHQEDGTSWVSVLMRTGVAISVANRVRRAAKALPAIDPETGERDTRTLQQKEADLFAHWLTTSEGTSTDIRAEIAISINATDLIGYTSGPGTIRGDGEPVPAGWVRELAASEHTILRRLVLDPVGHVLDTTVLSFRPPDSLRQALHWRDGTCRVISCRAPVSETDLDHEIAHDTGGPTSGTNLRCLCRKHHNMKSHGRLDDHFLDAPVTHRERYHQTAPLVIEFDTSGPRAA